MVTKIAIDSGRSDTKVCTKNGYFKFPSMLGEWYGLSGFREQKYGKYDLQIEYNGQKWYGGTLAKTCDFKTTMHTETKDNIENLVLVLSAIHLSCEPGIVDVIVAEPISSHTDTNKQRLSGMIMGKKVITINGVTKEFYINNAYVVCEGGVAAYSLKKDEIPKIMHVLDFGSATVNGATLLDKQYVKQQSYTLPFGLDTNETADVEKMARVVISQFARKWGKGDYISVVGGGAELFLPYVKEHFTNVHLHDKYDFANVIGMWRVINGI